jgi:BirA family biotin operon repressor/biotin-[acetyl-CoA-carboxylase] ligase
VVVGIGINVNWRRGDLPDGAVAINLAAGRPLDRVELLVGLLEHLEHRCRQLASPQGQAALAADYGAASATIGREVLVELPERTVIGRAERIDERGHLWLLEEGQPVEVTVGDVIHLRGLD